MEDCSVLSSWVHIGQSNDLNKYLTGLQKGDKWVHWGILKRINKKNMNIYVLICFYFSFAFHYLPPLTATSSFLT